MSLRCHCCSCNYGAWPAAPVTAVEKSSQENDVQTYVKCDVDVGEAALWPYDANGVVL